MTEFKQEQNNVKKGVVAAVVSSAVVVYTGYHTFPLTLPSMSTTSDRLAFTLQLDLLLAFLYLAIIGTVGNQRFFRHEAISGTTELTGSIEINRRVLQNTTEQLILVLLAHLALTTVVAEEAMKIIPILVVWWVLARLAFWYGYHQSAVGRAFGFAATFYPTFAAMLYSGFKILF